MFQRLRHLRLHDDHVLLFLQESSDKSVIELQQFAKKNKPNLHILNKLQEEMRKLAKQRVRSVPGTGPAH